MNTEKRIEAHLKQSVGSLHTDSHLDEVMREGRRRRTQSRIATTLMAAAAVVAVVVFGSSLIPAGRDADTVATSPDTSAVPTTAVTETTITDRSDPVVPSSSIAGIIVADQSGVTVTDRAGQRVAHLESDRYFSEIATAFSDLNGGLVFQHAVTPLPWPQGAIMLLRAGASRPEVLVAPPDGGFVVPVGPAVSAAGNAAFVYLEQLPEAILSPTVNVIDLATGVTTDVAQATEYSDVATGGDLVVLVSRNDECATLSAVTVDGSTPNTSFTDCYPLGASVAVSGDGESIAVLVNGTLEILDADSGAVVSEQSFPASNLVASGTGGWLVRTPDEVLLVDGGGTTSLPGVAQGWAVPYGGSLDLDPDASLGSGTGELPCVPFTEPLVEQPLPAAVADMRRAIFEAAANCDYETLSRLAIDSGTTFSFGSTSDPASFWVAGGRRGEEPLATIAAIVNTTPAEGPGSSWAWPAVHQDPSNEASWAELEPILGAETVAELRRFGEGYLGLRVGIDAEGNWQFAVSGD